MTEETVGMKLAEAGDGPKVLQLLKQLSQESQTALFTGLADMDEQQASQNLGAWSQRNYGLILLAELGTTPLGIVTITPQAGKKGSGELGVAVLKQYWHQGIGSMLVDEACYWFQHFSSLTTLNLEVVNDNQAALAIYQHCGFKVVEQNEQTSWMTMKKR